MQLWMSQFLKALIIFGVIYCASASMEETANNMMISNGPYGRSLVKKKKMHFKSILFENSHC